MTSPAKQQPGQASTPLKPPGLVELLTTRTYRVNPFSTVFHLGMVGVLITGILLEIMYLTGLAAAFAGWGWLLTWTHGVFGLITAVGFIGILVRFASNKFFRVTAGRMFYVDSIFIGVISITGITLLLRMLDILPALWGWETTLHIVSIIAWLLVSLFYGGLVTHAISSIVYSTADSRSQAAFQAFHTIGSLNRIQLAAHVSGSTSPRPPPLPKGAGGERQLWMGYSDHWIRMIKCQDACPVHTDVCGYITAIAEGRDEDAYRIARAANPFASICGRVCGAPCELHCRRGDVDAPVSIRALKRFVTEKHGPETGNDRLYHEACDERMLPPDRGDYEKVAVVGAGVAGLTVAHDLRRLGYKVSVFEADSVPGGMLTTGVPVFRLPRELAQNEIQAILSLEIDLQCNMRLGRDFSIEDLRTQGFKVIFLGVGLPKGRKPAIPGADLPNVYDGLELLRSFNEGAPLPLGRRIVVIGGGYVAYDVARSALRTGNNKEVHVVCLEQRHEMPADEREIIQGEEEGVRLHVGWGPKAIVQRDAGTVLRTVKCTSVFDENGQFSPSFDESIAEEIDVDNVLFAIGQTSDLSFLRPEDNVESERDLIKVNPETYQTTVPDIFACGDIAHGARLFIDAIASAHMAARSMHDYLRAKRTDVVVRKKWKPASHTTINGWERLERRDAPVIPAERRAASLDLIEEVYPEAEARRESSRCLRCNVNTIFDTSICVACNNCVDVCPESIIKPVGLSRFATDEEWRQQASITFRVPVDDLKAMNADQLDSLGAVMMKDETTCIRCAACASRCPTTAVSMQAFELYRECVSFPTRNPNLNYADG